MRSAYTEPWVLTVGEILAVAQELLRVFLK